MRPASTLRFALLLLALGLLAPSAAWAWGREGHRVVADLAEAKLHPAARAEVARLLAAEPAAHLAEVASWADDQRTAGGVDPTGTPADPRIHYVNFVGGCDFVPTRDCPNGRCAIGAINRQFLVLSDVRRPDAERLVALKLLVHLVGDVHQPLHASATTDRGGNDYQLSWHGMGRNLHSTWDTLLLQHAMDADGRDEPGFVAELQARPVLAADPTGQSDRPAVDWALESCKLVRDGGIYPSGHLLTDDYLDAHRGQMETRLRRAGDRLAEMLNYALDPANRKTVR